MRADQRRSTSERSRSHELGASYARCRRLHRAHGTTYYWATRALPQADQGHVHALYGLCRYADEIVDAPGGGDTADRAAALDALREGFCQGVDAGMSSHPILAAVIDTVQHLSIDPQLLLRFFDAMQMDLSVSSYRTHGELVRYMDGSAAVIGELMLPVLRPPDPDAARPGARALGIAFQLTNFLRDVDEDLDRGRVYLPLEDLERFGADPRRRAVDGPWRDFSRFQIARIRAIYREADAGIALLPPRSAKVIRAARVLYSGILDRIEDADHDVFSARARIATPVKMAVVGREMVRRSAPVAAAGGDPVAVAGGTGANSPRASDGPTTPTTSPSPLPARR
ncbi:MAG: phytoene/squalene synthase family protein [Nitriliruptoraceae bacterium]